MSARGRSKEDAKSYHSNPPDPWSSMHVERSDSLSYISDVQSAVAQLEQRLSQSTLSVPANTSLPSKPLSFDVSSSSAHSLLVPQPVTVNEKVQKFESEGLFARHKVSRSDSHIVVPPPPPASISTVDSFGPSSYPNSSITNAERSIPDSFDDAVSQIHQQSQIPKPTVPSVDTSALSAPNISLVAGLQRDLQPSDADTDYSENAYDTALSSFAESNSSSLASARRRFELLSSLTSSSNGPIENSSRATSLEMDRRNTTAEADNTQNQQTQGNKTAIMAAVSKFEAAPVTEPSSSERVLIPSKSIAETIARFETTSSSLTMQGTTESSATQDLQAKEKSVPYHVCVEETVFETSAHPKERLHSETDSSEDKQDSSIASSITATSEKPSTPATNQDLMQEHSDSTQVHVREENEDDGLHAGKLDNVGMHATEGKDTQSATNGTLQAEKFETSASDATNGFKETMNCENLDMHGSQSHSSLTMTTIATKDSSDISAEMSEPNFAQSDVLTPNILSSERSDVPSTATSTQETQKQTEDTLEKAGGEENLDSSTQSATLEQERDIQGRNEKEGDKELHILGKVVTDYNSRPVEEKGNPSIEESREPLTSLPLKSMNDVKAKEPVEARSEADARLPAPRPTVDQMVARLDSLELSFQAEDLGSISASANAESRTSPDTSDVGPADVQAESTEETAEVAQLAQAKDSEGSQLNSEAQVYDAPKTSPIIEEGSGFTESQSINHPTGHKEGVVAHASSAQESSNVDLLAKVGADENAAVDLQSGSISNVEEINKGIEKIVPQVEAPNEPFAENFSQLQPSTQPSDLGNQNEKEDNYREERQDTGFPHSSEQRIVEKKSLVDVVESEVATSVQVSAQSVIPITNSNTAVVEIIPKSQPAISTAPISSIVCKDTPTSGTATEESIKVQGGSDLNKADVSSTVETAKETDSKPSNGMDSGVMMKPSSMAALGQDANNKTGSESNDFGNKDGSEQNLEDRPISSFVIDTRPMMRQKGVRGTNTNTNTTRNEEGSVRLAHSVNVDGKDGSMLDENKVSTNEKEVNHPSMVSDTDNRDRDTKLISSETTDEGATPEPSGISTTSELVNGNNKTVSVTPTNALDARTDLETSVNSGPKQKEVETPSRAKKALNCDDHLGVEKGAPPSVDGLSDSSGKGAGMSGETAACHENRNGSTRKNSQLILATGTISSANKPKGPIRAPRTVRAKSKGDTKRIEGSTIETKAKGSTAAKAAEVTAQKHKGSQVAGSQRTIINKMAEGNSPTMRGTVPASPPLRDRHNKFDFEAALDSPIITAHEIAEIGDMEIDMNDSSIIDNDDLLEEAEKLVAEFEKPRASRRMSLPSERTSRRVGGPSSRALREDSTHAGDVRGTNVAATGTGAHARKDEQVVTGNKGKASREGEDVIGKQLQASEDLYITSKHRGSVRNNVTPTGDMIAVAKTSQRKNVSSSPSVRVVRREASVQKSRLPPPTRHSKEQNRARTQSGASKELTGSVTSTPEKRQEVGGLHTRVAVAVTTKRKEQSQKAEDPLSSPILPPNIYDSPGSPITPDKDMRRSPGDKNRVVDCQRITSESRYIHVASSGNRTASQAGMSATRLSRPRSSGFPTLATRMQGTFENVSPAGDRSTEPLGGHVSYSPSVGKTTEGRNGRSGRYSQGSSSRGVSPMSERRKSIDRVSGAKPPRKSLDQSFSKLPRVAHLTGNEGREKAERAAALGGEAEGGSSQSATRSRLPRGSTFSGVLPRARLSVSSLSRSKVAGSAAGTKRRESGESDTGSVVKSGIVERRTAGLGDGSHGVRPPLRRTLSFSQGNQKGTQGDGVDISQPSSPAGMGVADGEDDGSVSGRVGRRGTFSMPKPMLLRIPKHKPTVPEPFQLSGIAVHEKTQNQIEMARRRAAEMESRRRAFKARPMPDFSHPSPKPFR